MWSPPEIPWNTKGSDPSPRACIIAAMSEKPNDRDDAAETRKDQPPQEDDALLEEGKRRLEETLEGDLNETLGE